jgi:hypothetical protein
MALYCCGGHTSFPNLLYRLLLSDQPLLDKQEAHRIAEVTALDYPALPVNTPLNSEGAIKANEETYQRLLSALTRMRALVLESAL